MKKHLFSAILAAGISATGLAQGLQRDVQYWRPYDQRGVNFFETGKQDTVAFDGVKVRVGGHFAQQLQSLSHENKATPVITNGVNVKTTGKM